MSINWIGCLVSLDCGDVLGTYQGQVKAVDNSGQTLTISHTYRNGIACEIPEITINAADIKDLKLVKGPEEAACIMLKPTTPSKLKTEETEQEAVAPTVKVLEPQIGGYPDSNHGNNNFHVSPSRYRQQTPTRDRGENFQFYRNGSSPRYTPTKEDQVELRSRRNSASDEKCSRSSLTPRKIEFRRKPAIRENCFSAPVESMLDDFDFEKNLKLFDKKAVFEEIENGQPVVVKVAESKSQYRHDENILNSGPVTFQQIKLPSPAEQKYVTDSGLVIPCITYDMRCRLFAASEKYGFSVERRIEMVGRSASEMVLQLLGGSHRLNPQNGHQLPTVVILCCPHIQGAQGLNCARQIANHNVKTVVVIPHLGHMEKIVEDELNLYKLCNRKTFTSAKDAITGAVDMIINCMDSHESDMPQQTWYKIHEEWANQNKAPVLTIDPLINGTTVQAKWCLQLVLPLPLKGNNSQVYLCDLGFPKQVFLDAGIKYISPFSHKFVIPLHPNS
ncbi:hypothetical protein CHS0354_007790 [Potamilus streckersoni]|uniref:Enhancer of mRNA-decapping protein 3 n=1 Tax=Potamilus streckersoni TaxID=2493646 RepID=A0AAE0TEU8_9BIVA|nr:hypothetical protein CHS0354_007790 [Potamilus streckersoni]